MKLTAEHFNQRYEAMSDDELLSIDPAELNDVASKCYQAELTRRSLTETSELPEEAEEAEGAADVGRAAFRTLFGMADRMLGQITQKLAKGF